MFSKMKTNDDINLKFLIFKNIRFNNFEAILNTHERLKPANSLRHDPDVYYIILRIRIQQN